MGKTVTVYATEEARSRAGKEALCSCGASPKRGRKKSCPACEAQELQAAVRNQTFEKEGAEE